MTSDNPILAQISDSDTSADSGSRQYEAASSATGLRNTALSVQDEPQRDEELPITGTGLLSEGSPLAGLPLQLDVVIAVPQFRVHNLLALEKGSVLACGWVHTEDVPVWSGGEQLLWAEFEVIDQKLAVRVTRVA